VAAIRTAFAVDIREHRLAWSVIVAGLLASAMLWGSILGLPMARPDPYSMAGPSVDVQVEHPIEFEARE
jgi:hypothetical protein